MPAKPKPEPLPKLKPSKGSLDKAIADLQRRAALTDKEARALRDRAKKHAYWNAQVHDLRVADAVLKDLQRAVRDGEDFAEWKKRAGRKLRAAWGPGAVDAAGRTINQGARARLIYRNNTMTAYNRGRFHQLRKPNVLNLRPYWRYDAVMDDATTPLCRSLHGTILPATHSFWETRNPPLHHGCRSTLRALMRVEAERQGIKPRAPGRLKAMPGFGEVPSEAEIALADVDLMNVDPALVRAFNKKPKAPKKR